MAPESAASTMKVMARASMLVLAPATDRRGLPVAMQSPINTTVMTADRRVVARIESIPSRPTLPRMATPAAPRAETTPRLIQES